MLCTSAISARFFFDNGTDESTHLQTVHGNAELETLLHLPPAKRARMNSMAVPHISLEGLNKIASEVEEQPDPMEEEEEDYPPEDERNPASKPENFTIDDLYEMLELDPEDDFMETDEPAEEIPESKKYQEKIFQSLEEFILFVFYQQEGSNRTSVRRMNLLLLLLADPRIDVKKFPKSMKSIFFFFFFFFVLFFFFPLY